MTGRTGKHFRGDKDLIIHDKTGRVIYLYLSERPPVYLYCIQSYTEICPRCFVNFSNLAHRFYTVCIFFYLQILISWNRFARSLKEAFELYWETKQVCARGGTVLDIRWFDDWTRVRCGRCKSVYFSVHVLNACRFQLVHFVWFACSFKRNADFSCTFHCFQSGSFAGI